jgi:hypothetical protein
MVLDVYAGRTAKNVGNTPSQALELGPSHAPCKNVFAKFEPMALALYREKKPFTNRPDPAIMNNKDRALLQRTKTISQRFCHHAVDCDSTLHFTPGITTYHHQRELQLTRNGTRKHHSASIRSSHRNGRAIQWSNSQLQCRRRMGLRPAATGVGVLQYITREYAPRLHEVLHWP